MSYCSPNNTKNIGTCYDTNELIEISKAYNKSVKKNKVICNDNTCIKTNEYIDLNLNKKDLYKSINEKFSKLCTNEYCWIDLDFINEISNKNVLENIKYFTFKPKQTDKIDTWLTSDIINETMSQYQELYKNYFEFLGAQPSDFHKVIDFPTVKKRYIGIVLNTDPHTKKGQHWLSVYIDNKLKTVEYFDSLGNMPNKNIASFLKNFKTYKFKFNKIKHQTKGSQCGIYACFFLIQRLGGYSFEEINSKFIDDKYMKKYRKSLFR